MKALLEALIVLEQRKDALYETRYSPPVVDRTDHSGIPPMDTAGAWAMEMALSGTRVSDEEIKLQRRMRLEAGL